MRTYIDCYEDFVASLYTYEFENFEDASKRYQCPEGKIRFYFNEYDEMSIQFELSNKTDPKPIKTLIKHMIDNNETHALSTTVCFHASFWKLDEYGIETFDYMNYTLRNVNGDAVVLKKDIVENVFEDRR
jgi:hypothetical protein